MRVADGRHASGVPAFRFDAAHLQGRRGSVSRSGRFDHRRRTRGFLFETGVGARQLDRRAIAPGRRPAAVRRARGFAGRSPCAARGFLGLRRGTCTRTDLFRAHADAAVERPRIDPAWAVAAFLRIHPAVAGALERFRTSSDVRAVAAAAGYGHRHFNALFVRAVGLTPKLYSGCGASGMSGERRQRSSKSLADLALATGYSDQSHFNREFREFSGFAPGDYRRIAPRFPHHVPLHPGQFRARRANGFAPD